MDLKNLVSSKEIIFTEFYLEFIDTSQNFLVDVNNIINYMEIASRKGIAIDFFNKNGILLSVHPKKNKKLNIAATLKRLDI